MRKVILGLAVSLDGFIEGPNGEYDWCFTDQDYGMKAFFSGIDALFIGRKSYEVLKKEEQGDQGDFALPPLHTYLFSRTLNVQESDTTVLGDVTAEIIDEIREKPGKDIWLFGGAQLVSTFMHLDRIDEIWLSVHPVLLGSGKPLFAGLTERKYLTLKESKAYDTGLLSLRYVRKQG